METEEPSKNLLTPKKTTSGKAMQPENPTDNLPHFPPLESHHGTRKKQSVSSMQVLGRKNIKNTLIYTQLISPKDDDFICKAAKTVDEAAKLVEARFDFVCEIQDCRLFRKRK